MVRVFYANGYVQEMTAPCRYFKTPRQARKLAVSLVTGVTANDDIVTTEYWGTDADGVESVETFHNELYLKAGN